jgi:hypothetical protein
VGSMLLRDPWVRAYLVMVGWLALAVLWDRLRHPPARQTSQPGEGRSTTPHGVAEKSPTQGSAISEAPLPADSKENRPNRCQDGDGERIRAERPIPGARPPQALIHPAITRPQVSRARTLDRVLGAPAAHELLLH